MDFIELNAYIYVSFILLNFIKIIRLNIDKTIKIIFNGVRSNILINNIYLDPDNESKSNNKKGDNNIISNKDKDKIFFDLINKFNNDNKKD